ncbi:Cobalt/zinc/cadmium efflux RND transporter, membrane fusion protein, CzcB family [Labilithrix luteola]|uniref:Cobalt/zinc/cadmium efflux RND transporter, membrane fusion protein, CzcB family n=1 Tax=Labilithrix luteola TaxID=1391654 RepID=A0A0K1PZ12_9BACT|nr:efflux RND transporter periplasmic adaptor subunit [Labilithrix luteola]AKU98765.1 Cobalt/zinc/cadmium efflux RND transporter, membrane fusion protein, CzcB family [Labilithrix luteola]
MTTKEVHGEDARNAAEREEEKPSREIVSWIVTVVLLGALVGYLALTKPPSMTQAPRADGPSAVRVTGPKEFRIEPGSSLESKLVVASVRTERTTSAILEVTGSIMASLPKGARTSEGRWQFSSPDLLSAYVDLQKSGAEVAFSRQQLNTAERLDATRVSAQEKVVERLSKLVQAGSDSPKDLAVEETNLEQAKLEGLKIVHEATAALRTAERTQAALQRQLEQAGLDPEALGSAKEGSALLVADVPESKIERAQQGQSSKARFYGLPGREFVGTVNRISPTVTREQRTLRVLVILDDKHGELRPGMFADVGLGTDERDALWAPSDGILHVGKSDYLLVSHGAGQWVVTEVTLGESRGPESEVLRGVPGGTKVLGQGAILLKPFVIESLAVGSP